MSLNYHNLMGYVGPHTHDADEITFDPTHTAPEVTATNVQDAIEQLQDQIDDHGRVLGVVVSWELWSRARLPPAW